MNNSGTSYKECTTCGWDCRPCRCEIERSQEVSKVDDIPAAYAAAPKLLKNNHRLINRLGAEVEALEERAEKAEAESEANLDALKQTQLMLWEESKQHNALKKDARVLSEAIRLNCKLCRVSGIAMGRPETCNYCPTQKAETEAMRILEATKEEP